MGDSSDWSWNSCTLTPPLCSTAAYDMTGSGEQHLTKGVSGSQLGDGGVRCCFTADATHSPPPSAANARKKCVLYVSCYPHQRMVPCWQWRESQCGLLPATHMLTSCPHIYKYTYTCMFPRSLTSY